MLWLNLSCLVVCFFPLKVIFKAVYLTYTGFLSCTAVGVNIPFLDSFFPSPFKIATFRFKQVLSYTSLICHCIFLQVGAFALCPFVDLRCKCLADLRKSALQTDLELFSLQSCSTATTLFTGISREERECIYIYKLYIIFV